MQTQIDILLRCLKMQNQGLEVERHSDKMCSESANQKTEKKPLLGIRIV